MAQSWQKGGHAFVKDTFGLPVAVLCSEDASIICKKNKLTFIELLRPFCRLTTEVRIRDQLGHYYKMTDLRVSLSEPQLEPISDAKHRLLLSQTVRQTEGNFDTEMSNRSLENIEIGGATPWYENYRDDFVQLMKQSDHEYIRHYMGSLLVVSSSNEDPAAAFTELYQQQKRMESLPYPKWLTPHVYCWHILLHDVVAGNAKRAGDLFDRIRGQYGAASCYLLQINSRGSSSSSTESLPDPWSQFLRHQRYTEDIDSPAQRSRMSRQLHHRDSIDGKQEVTSSVPPSNGNNTNKDSLNKMVLKPDDVREEASLTSYDEPDSSSLVTSSLSSSNIELGSDPLSRSPSISEQRKIRSAQSSPYLNRANKPVETRTDSSDKRSSSYNTLSGYQQPAKTVVRYGIHLTLEDHNRLQRFLEEFVTRGLLPHLEQLTRTMNERLASRQGLRRTLISATRKWLGGGRQLNHMSPGTHNAINSSSGYAHDSPELQMRQLGDLAFLLQNYELSYQTYNSARKDYQVDHAWLLYAGAVEMTALSLFMMGSNKKELSPYFEDALAVYRSNTKNTSLILRCMLLHCEVLKSRLLHREAANAFLKMSSEDNDLLCALCMEQAAHCFLKHTMKRKYSFHMILAGHYYSKTAQRMHSARAYMQALQIIKDKSWILAEDYINFSLARHSFSMKRLVEAKQAFEKLFVHKSFQLTFQQETNIKEYIFIHKQLLDQLNTKQRLRLYEKNTSLTSRANTEHIPILPLPSINVAKTRVIFGVDRWTQVESSHEGKQQNLNISNEKLSVTSSPAGSKPTSRNSSPLAPRKSPSNSSLWVYSSGACEVGKPRHRWEGLECVAAAGTTKQLSHKQILYLDHTTDNTNIARVVKNETIAVELQLVNLLNVNLNLSGVSLIWDMEQKQDEDKEAVVSCEVISEYLLPASELRTLCLHITPLCVGNLHVLGILFSLGVDVSSDLPPNSPLQSVMHSASQFQLAGSAKDSVLHQTKPDLESYLAEGIQGRVPLTIPDRRVHRTQSKPYTVVLQSDYRLSWQIVPAMPKLLVGMCGFPMSLLAGEICRVLLEVENFGQEPLNNLRLASSHHHLLLLEKDPAVSKNAIYSTSVFEQTSDKTHTVMKIQTPLEWKDFSLPDGQLLPGQKQQLSMLIQAPSYPGQHTVDMLYYYQPTQVTSKLDHRVVEHSCKVMVKDSLNINHTQSSSYQPLYEDDGMFNLDKFVISLEIENKCQVTSDSTSVREIRILQVTCVSPHWTIQRCSKQHGIISLVAGMAALLHLKVVRSMKERSEDVDSLLFSDVALGQAKVITDTAPVSDLFFGSEVCHRILNTAGSSTSDGWSDNKATISATTTGTSHLALIVFWQALLPTSQGTKFNYGQQYVLVPIPQSHQEQQRIPANISSGLTYPESSEWVRFSLQHPTHCPHDFSTSRVCIVPVKLLLHNCSHCDLDVLIDFSPQDAANKISTSSINKFSSSQRFTQEFCWSGVCRRQLRMLKHATTTVDIRACFSQPGVYNLTNFSLYACASSKVNRYQLQKWIISSMIIIG